MIIEKPMIELMDKLAQKHSEQIRKVWPAHMLQRDAKTIDLILAKAVSQ